MLLMENELGIRWLIIDVTRLIKERGNIMSPKSLDEYTEVIAKRYKRACYKTKIELLNEYCQVTGLHRKHCIRKLNNFKFFQKPKKNKRGRKSIYNYPSILKPLKKIWLTANLPCSKLLKALLPNWLPLCSSRIRFR